MAIMASFNFWMLRKKIFFVLQFSVKRFLAVYIVRVLPPPSLPKKNKALPTDKGSIPLWS